MSRMRPFHPLLERTAPVAAPQAQARDPQPRRLSVAVAFSLALHALVLSLTIGGQGFGRPGFGFPWQERRVEVPDLQVFLLPPAESAAAPGATAGPVPLLVPEPLPVAVPAPVMAWTSTVSTWMGLRHSRLDRSRPHRGFGHPVRGAA